MNEKTTIDKQPFTVDMKLVWAAAAAIAYMVYTGTTRLNAIEADINSFKQSAATVAQVKEDQGRTKNEVKTLQDQFSRLEMAQRETTAKLETVSAGITTVQGQLTQLAQATQALREKAAQK